MEDSFKQCLPTQLKSDLEEAGECRKSLAVLNKYTRIKNSLEEMMRKSTKGTIRISKKKWAFVKRNPESTTETKENIEAVIEEMDQIMTQTASQFPGEIVRCELCFVFYALTCSKAHVKSLDHVTKERDMYKAQLNA